jgi:aminoglycoside phosphotransferase
MRVSELARADGSACPSAQSLVGLSGAEVRLIADSRRPWIVRKIARDAAGNERLRRQAEKQQAFAQAGLCLRTPCVLQQGKLDDRFFFDMEYVRGLDGASFLRRASYAEVVRFVDQLSQYLAKAAQSQPLCHSACSGLFEALFAKLCEVQRATRSISSDTLAQLFQLLDRVRTLDRLPATLCHGDLTLQNIIVDHEGAIWAVDLLDAPFEHYWQDVAKLHQDLIGGWFLIDQPPIAECVLDHVSRQLLNRATELDRSYLAVHYLLVATTFVRILPYAKTSEQSEFVLERIDHFTQCGSRQL